MNVILFFDEADSLFAKRSEVKDSNDRNANAETAHLLQKMEEYEGMVILATNLVDQIDDAFRRRIKFMIPFRFPDVETRKKLWHSLIPDKTPLEDGIDLDFLRKLLNFPAARSKRYCGMQHISLLLIKNRWGMNSSKKPLCGTI